MTAFKIPGRGRSLWRYDGVEGNSRSLAGLEMTNFGERQRPQAQKSGTELHGGD